MFVRLWRNRAGASLIEYAFIVGIVTAIFVAGVAFAGGWVGGLWVRLLGALG
jgi:Flp pilus assembly pilin Flp